MIDEIVQALICTCSWLLDFVGKFNFFIKDLL